MSDTKQDKSDGNDVCKHCGSRNTAPLTDTEHECYDCGKTYRIRRSQ